MKEANVRNLLMREKVSTAARSLYIESKRKGKTSKSPSLGKGSFAIYFSFED